MQYLESSFQLPKPSFNIEDAPPSSLFPPDETMTWEDIVKTILNTQRTKAAYFTEDSSRGRPHSFLIDYPYISNDSEAFLAKTTLHDIPKNVDNFDSLSQAQQTKLVRLFEDMALAGYIVSDQNSPDSKLELWNAILDHHLNSAPAELNLGSLIERRDVKTALGEAYQSGWFEVSRSRYEASNQEGSL